VFTREDFLDGEEVKTVIKVNNTKLNVCTHWSLSKFEEKLMQMRDIYQVCVKTIPDCNSSYCKKKIFVGHKFS
jgi:hypothetical protein